MANRPSVGISSTGALPEEKRPEDRCSTRTSSPVTSTAEVPSISTVAWHSEAATDHPEPHRPKVKLSKLVLK